MTQLRNKFEIEDIDNEDEGLKILPNAFNDTKDEMSFIKAIILSLIFHPLVVFLIFAIITILGFVLPKVEKPQWKQRDIEFVLVTKEAEPINKNTKYRADINSRAGGKHDPTKKVSEPSPSPSPSPKANIPAAPKKQPAKQASKQPVKKPVKQQNWADQITKAITKPVQQPVQKSPVPPKPTQAPPSQRPIAKPTNTPARPSMPKLATAPKSPFSIEVPRTNAPVGNRPSAGTGSGTGYSSAGGTSTSAGGSGRPAGMPAPQFSTSRGTSKGTGSGTGSSGRSGTGSYGSGNMGNPGPGNPSGPPGIDAIKSPDWGPYMRELERRIKRNWNPPKGDASKRVVVMFKIGRDGRLLSIRITKSSGSATNDDAAKAAIELTAPFKPLPPEFKGSSIDIEFTFDYNVLGASYR